MLSPAPGSGIDATEDRMEAFRKLSLMLVMLLLTVDAAVVAVAPDSFIAACAAW